MANPAKVEIFLVEQTSLQTPAPKLCALIPAIPVFPGRTYVNAVNFALNRRVGAI